MTQSEFFAQFDRDYIAAQIPSVQALFKLELGGTRNDTALHLAKTGALMDTPIVVVGYDPHLMHLIRTYDGIPYIGGTYGGMKPPGMESGSISPYGLYERPWPPTPVGCLPTVDFQVDSSSRWDIGTGDAYQQTVLDRLHALYPLPVVLPATPHAPDASIVGPFIARGIRAVGPGAVKGAVEDRKAYAAEDGSNWIAHVSEGFAGGWACFFVPAK